MRAASPLRQIERENEMIVISHRVFCVGFRGSPWGVLSLDGMKEGSGFYRFRGESGGGAALFVILSGEKRRMLENGLSKIGGGSPPFWMRGFPYRQPPLRVMLLS